MRRRMTTGWVAPPARLLTGSATRGTAVGTSEDEFITPSGQPQRGYDIAKQALEEARARARAEGKQVGRGRTGPVGPGRRLRKRGWTGSRSEERRVGKDGGVRWG